jgi:hypothetical protein
MFMDLGAKLSLSDGKTPRFSDPGWHRKPGEFAHKDPGWHALVVPSIDIDMVLT